MIRGARLYIDCHAGIAGDMLLGAFIDLGVPVEVVKTAIDALGFPDIALEVSSVRRGALIGRKVDVRHRGKSAGHAHGPVVAHDHHADHPHGGHRHHAYREIRARIEARTSAEVRGWALAIFDSIAESEGRMHGVPTMDVALHEIGAADSIADIVGCAAALAWLSPSRIDARAVPLGSGAVQTAHGRLPVPAPATLDLLRGCLTAEDGEGELTTPTGAALVRAMVLAPPVGEAGRFGAMPSGVVRAIGWGAGTRELRDRPNVLRVVAIECAAAQANEVVEKLEANIDDLNPVLSAALLDAFLAAGALDAWLTPIVMKKGRPALLVAVLAPAERRAAIEAVFFAESSTLGVRRSVWDRTTLDREIVEVVTSLGPIEVKLAGHRGANGEWLRVTTATPEFESCRRLAEARGVPLRRVYEVAAAEAHRRLS